MACGLAANAQHAGHGLAGADGTDRGGIGIGHVACVQAAGARGKHHLQRSHHKGRHAHVAGRHFLLQQPLRDLVTPGRVQRAQLLQQRLQRRRQAIGARQGIEHAVQHAMPGGIDMVGGRQQRHGMLLRPRDQRRIGRGQRQLPGRLGLRVHDLRHKPQVVGNRIALGQLPQPRRPLDEQPRQLRQQHARKTGVVQRLDIAGLKNALHWNESQKNSRPDRWAAGCSG